MAYSKNLLPKASIYYTLSNAHMGDTLTLSAGGYAEKQITTEDLPKLTSKMQVAVFPAKFFDRYSNDAVQVNISVLTTTEQYIEYLLPVTYDKSGVFTVEIELPEQEYQTFIWRLSSKVPIEIYSWELRAEQEVDLTTVIEGVEQSLPHVLYDYNTWPLQVDQMEAVIGMIACNLLGDTDVNGHFCMDFYASEHCNVYIRFKDNEVTELYTPMLFTVFPGHNTIGIPHAYLKRLAGIHNFVVTCQCTNGVLDIYPRGLLYTIDAGYLAERLLDAGLDIMDLSIRQVDAGAGPDEIWCVGSDAGEILVKSRPYQIQGNTAWTPRYSLGRGLDAAIEFDGDWIRLNDKANFTIMTHESPFMFLVDLEGNLLCNIYDEGSYLNVLLDTGVKSVSAIRGYKSNVYVDQDQGMVVAYVKDNGEAYYRQYKYFSALGKHNWDTAVLLDTNVLQVVVNRLNDYRIGFTLTYADHNRLLVSDRTYVAQAIKPEQLKTNTDLDRILFNLDPTITSTIGTCASMDASVGVDILEIVYVAPIRDYYEADGYIDGVQYLRERMRVTCDRVSDINVTELLIADNKLVVKLDKIVMGVITINIPEYNYLYLSNETEVRLGRFITGQTITITILNTQKFYVTDSTHLGLVASGQPVIKEMITTRVFSPEDIIVDPSITVTESAAQEVTTTKQPADDNIPVSLSVTGTFTVIATGTSPI